MEHEKYAGTAETAADQGASIADQFLDANLRRTYPEPAEEPLPERFEKLLQKFH